MRPSEIAFWLAKHQPRLARLGLDTWARCSARFGNRERTPHWVYVQMSNQLNHRTLLKTRLGNGMRIHVPWNDFIGRSILAHGYYEPETVQLISHLVKQGMTCFDIGAHVGQYTLVTSQRVGESGQVHAFEPDPETYRCLVGNVKANHLANVHANHLALTSKDGPRKLYLASQDGIGCNSMAPPVNFSGREVEVPCVTLDEYLAQHNVARVDFIKMDVEGAELLVLQGGEALFQRPDKPIMILEFEEARQKAFGNSCTKLYEFLHARGYQLYRLVDGELSPYKPGPGDPVTFNVLAVPEARMDALANVKRA